MPRVSPKQFLAARRLGEARPLTVGFYVTWDDFSFASLEAQIAKLDWMVPSWLEAHRPRHGDKDRRRSEVAGLVAAREAAPERAADAAERD